MTRNASTNYRLHRATRQRARIRAHLNKIMERPIETCPVCGGLTSHPRINDIDTEQLCDGCDDLL